MQSADDLSDLHLSVVPCLFFWHRKICNSVTSKLADPSVLVECASAFFWYTLPKTSQELGYACILCRRDLEELRDT